MFRPLMSLFLILYISINERLVPNSLSNKLLNINTLLKFFSLIFTVDRYTEVNQGASKVQIKFDNFGSNFGTPDLTNYISGRRTSLVGSLIIRVTHK
jgi:hypothetical protein